MRSARRRRIRGAISDGFNFRATNAPGKGTGDGITKPGGTCSGDSGDLVFYGKTNVIVGITSLGLNAKCKGGDYAYRADIATSQSFLD